MNLKEHAILYVDDERPNRIVFEQSFNDQFTIKTAASAAEALELIKTLNVGVIVTDQRMPNMSGNELLAHVKQTHPSVVRVVITAYSDLEPILRAVNEGLVARYVIKPWDRDELRKILAWAMEVFIGGKEDSEIQLRLMQTERLITLGSIGAAVIHDLNQPITFMHNNTEWLMQRSESLGALKELLQRYGDTLPARDLKNLTNLCEDLPDVLSDFRAGCQLMHGMMGSFRRILQPGRDPEQLNTNPSPVIRYAIGACNSVAVECGARIVYDGPQDLPNLRISFTYLAQILINLLSNGAQAVGRRPGIGGGRVILSASEQPEHVVFTVKDDGVGMSPEVLKKIGTPFFSTRAQGTGLGVLQSRRLVEGHGGEFGVQSKENVGTTVSIRLPKSP